MLHQREGSHERGFSTCIFGRHRWACACPVKRASDAMIIAMYFLMVSALEVR